MAWLSRAELRAGARSWTTRLAAGIAGGLLLVLLASSSAVAKPNNELNKTRLESTVRYLQNVQNSDGGFAGEAGGGSSTLYSAWVALALAAAGINPQDQSREGDADVYTYLTAHAHELSATTDFERELLVADAAGTNPKEFGGVDLVSEILARQLKTGSEAGAFVYQAGEQTPGVNDTIFAIVALSPVEEEATHVAVKDAAEWLIHEQNADGGWPAISPKTASSEAKDNIEMTAAAIEALNAAGMHNTSAQMHALEYLHKVQDSDGGFPEVAGEGESNVASTAWVVQGLWSAGENPENWKQQSSGKEPLGYLEAMKHEDGSIQWKASSNANPVWMTAYAAPAFAGQPLPIPAVPREHNASPGGNPPPPPSSPSESGDISSPPRVVGSRSQPGSGVLADGGGHGARIFSRPQPQSDGATPGGIRLLEPRGHATGNAAEHPRNPGAPRRTPVPTTTEAGGRAVGASAASVAGDSRGAGGLLPAAASRAGTPGSEAVKGLLLGTSLAAFRGALGASAPGLQSAGVGGKRSPWLASAIAAAAILLALGGARLERRRPRPIL